MAHGVGMVVPDVDRAADGAYAQGHDDGQAHAGSVVDRFGHEQEALRGRGGVGTGAGERGADASAQGAEFGFDVDEVAILQGAFFDQAAETFDDVGLRGDRVGADDFRPAQRNGFRGGDRTFDLF